MKEQRKLAAIIGYSAMMSKDEKQAINQEIIRMTEKDLLLYLFYLYLALNVKLLRFRHYIVNCSI